MSSGTSTRPPAAVSTPLEYTSPCACVNPSPLPPLLLLSALNRCDGGTSNSLSSCSTLSRRSQFRLAILSAVEFRNEALCTRAVVPLFSTTSLQRGIGVGACTLVLFTTYIFTLYAEIFTCIVAASRSPVKARAVRSARSSKESTGSGAGSGASACPCCTCACTCA